MSTSSPPLGPIDLPFVCDCKEQYRSACDGEAFYREHEGKRYCVLHFPGMDKIQAFNEAFQKKLQKGGDLDFQGVSFPDEGLFSRFTFNEADFTGATFNAKANFFRAIFSEAAYFSGAIFKGEADFGGVRFREGVNFGTVLFSK